MADVHGRPYTLIRRWTCQSKAIQEREVVRRGYMTYRISEVPKVDVCIRRNICLMPNGRMKRDLAGQDSIHTIRMATGDRVIGKNREGQVREGFLARRNIEVDSNYKEAKETEIVKIKHVRDDKAVPKGEANKVKEVGQNGETLISALHV